MREVVEERDLSSLGEAIRRAQQVYRAVTGPAAAPRTATARQVTVFSPKGGVGKTTIAANLAVALAARKNLRVCLVDLDLAFGDIAITLQLFPARTIADAVLLEDALDFSVLEPLLTPHSCGFSTLVAPVQPDAKDSIPAVLIARVLDIAEEELRRASWSTPPPPSTSTCSRRSTRPTSCCWSPRSTCPTLKNVKIACETLDLLNFPKQQRHLVLNRADDKVGLAPEKVESTLDMTIEQRIPTSAEVANATNSGEPIVASHPKHAVSQAINHLADLVDRRARRPRPGKTKKAKPESPRARPPPQAREVAMSSLADRLAAASRDRAASQSTSSEVEAAGGRRKSKVTERDPFARAQGHRPQPAADPARPQAVRRQPDPGRAGAHGPRRPAGGDAGRGRRPHPGRPHPHRPGDRRRHPGLRARSSPSCATPT